MIEENNLEGWTVELQKALLNALYEAISRHSAEFVPGGSLANLSQEEKDRYSLVPTTNNGCERIMAIISRILSYCPRASPTFVTAKANLRYNKVTFRELQDINRKYPKLCQFAAQKWKSKKPWRETLDAREEQEARKREELRRLQEQKQAEKAEKLRQLTARPNVPRKTISSLSVQELKEEAKKHNLSIRGPQKGDYVMLLLAKSADPERDELLFNKMKAAELKKEAKEKYNIVLRQPTKEDYIRALRQHIQKDDSCDCHLQPFPPRTPDSYKGKLAVIILDFETDGWGNLMSVNAYDLVTGQLWRETDTLIVVPKEQQHQTESPYRQHSLTYEMTEREGQPWAEVWEGILEWLHTLAVPQVLWLAHNGASFDFHCLHLACLHNSIESPLSRRDFIFGDTLKLCRYVRTDLVSNGISKMLSDYNIPFQDRHTATGDVKALASILQVMLAEKTQDMVKYLLHFFQQPTYTSKPKDIQNKQPQKGKELPQERRESVRATVHTVAQEVTYPEPLPRARRKAVPRHLNEYELNLG